MCWNGIGLAIFNCRGAFRVPGRATASAWPRSTYKPSAISWHLNTVAAHATIIGAIPYSGSPSHGQRAGSGESGPGLFVRLGRSVNNPYGAGRLFACRHCYQLAYASQREPAHLRGLKNHKRSECGWVEARTCLTIFRRNPRACTGARMRDGVACTIWPNSDRPSA